MQKNIKSENFSLQRPLKKNWKGTDFMKESQQATDSKVNLFVLNCSLFILKNFIKL